MDKTRGNLPNSRYTVCKNFNSSRRLRFSGQSFCTRAITSLPTDVMLLILDRLSMKDILSLQSCHPFFKDLIDSHPSIWKTVGFMDIWPSSANIKHFQKAADLGNVEALIKLAVAYLYNEGFSAPSVVDGQKISSNGKRAAELFCKVEDQSSCRPPLTWMFIRPPWAGGGTCCKECVFWNMKNFANQNKAPKVDVCIAKAYELLDAEKFSTDMMRHLQRAVDSGLSIAQYMLWEFNYKRVELSMDRGLELQSLRELREICWTGNVVAQLSLCHLYVTGIYGGYSCEDALAYVRKFVQSSVSVDVRNIYESSELTASMRHILVDWLVEVAYLRRYESLVLHLAVNVVDRFLRVHPVARVKLQLLGIAAVVLCSRCVGQDIMTIREGAYLTDHTYSYEEVVRMMGEIAACLNGHIRKLTSLDYVILIGLAARNDRRTQLLAEYFCELSLQFSDLSGYTQSRLAASCVLLARLTTGIDETWTDDLVAATGYDMKSLMTCTLHVHKKCFMEIPMSDRQEAPLQAVKLRYSDKLFLKVALMPMLTTAKLNSLLGVVTRARPSLRCGDKFEHDRDLIASPSRKSSRGAFDRSFNEIDLDREKAATPTLEMTNPGCMLNESGYDGDEEDGDLSMLDSSLENLELASEKSPISKPVPVGINPHASHSYSNLSVEILSQTSESPSVISVSSSQSKSLPAVCLEKPSSSCALQVETPSEVFCVGHPKSNSVKCVQDGCQSPVNPVLPSRLTRNKRRGSALAENTRKKSMLRRWQNSRF